MAIVKPKGAARGIYDERGRVTVTAERDFLLAFGLDINLSSAAKTVGNFLVYKFNDDPGCLHPGTAWPGFGYIASHTRLGRRTVAAAIKDLVNSKSGPAWFAKQTFRPEGKRPYNLYIPNWAIGAQLGTSAETSTINGAQNRTSTSAGIGTETSGQNRTLIDPTYKDPTKGARKRAGGLADAEGGDKADDAEDQPEANLDAYIETISDGAFDLRRVRKDGLYQHHWESATNAGYEPATIIAAAERLVRKAETFMRQRNERPRLYDAPTLIEMCGKVAKDQKEHRVRERAETWKEFQQQAYEKDEAAYVKLGASLKSYRSGKSAEQLLANQYRTLRKSDSSKHAKLMDALKQWVDRHREVPDDAAIEIICKEGIAKCERWLDTQELAAE